MLALAVTSRPVQLTCRAAGLAQSRRVLWAPKSDVYSSSFSTGRRVAGINQAIRMSMAEKLINAVSIGVRQSPLNLLKKGIAFAQAGNYDSAAIQSKIQSLVTEHPVVVFSFTTCPFCQSAKQLLKELGVQYKAVELDTLKDGNAVRAELTKLTDRTSVPNIFIGGQSYGGCNDGPGVIPLQRQGKLVPLLQAAGAL